MMWKRVKQLIPALRSRKVRVAFVTVIVAFAAEYGLNVSPELVLAIISVGISIILGIAHEDNGMKRCIGNWLPYEVKPPAEPKPTDEPK